MSAKELNAGIRKRNSSCDQKLQTIKQPHHAEAAQESRRKKNGTNTETKAAQTHAVSLITLTNPSSPIAEQYRTIRTNIQLPPQLVSKSKRLS